MTDETPAQGIAGYDLTPPTRPLWPGWQPIRYRPTAAEQNEARRRERERPGRIARETAEAMDEWRRYFDRHADNPVARAAFDIHQPEEGYDRVICGECRDSDTCDGTTGATWPCLTFTAMKEAADG